jgi:hypothetical protein
VLFSSFSCLMLCCIKKSVEEPARGSKAYIDYYTYQAKDIDVSNVGRYQVIRGNIY